MLQIGDRRLLIATRTGGHMLHDYSRWLRQEC